MKWAIDQEQPQKVTDKQRVLVCQSEVGLVVVNPEKPNFKGCSQGGVCTQSNSLLIFMFTYMSTSTYASCAQGQWARSLEAKTKGIFFFFCSESSQLLLVISSV